MATSRPSTVVSHALAMLARLRSAWLALLALSLAPGAWAFDGSTRLLLHEDRIEVVVILGTDAARSFLGSLGLANAEVLRMTRERADDRLGDLPLKQAPRLVVLQADGQALAASRFAVMPFENEVAFLIVCERPEASSVQLQAAYLGAVPSLRTSTFVATTGTDRRLLAKATLTQDQASIAVPLATGDALPAPGAWATAWQWAGLAIGSLLASLIGGLLLLAAWRKGMRARKPIQIQAVLPWPKTGAPDSLV